MVQSDGIHGFGTGSAESLPSKSVNPDRDSMKELIWALLDSKPVHNEFLDMKPEEIPGTSEAFGVKKFYSDSLDLLNLDIINKTHGSWKMIDRGQGWAIRDNAWRWGGWKRTLVFKPFQPSKSNKTWYMNVYAVIGADKFVKPLYRCEIFEVSNSYDPRPKCVSLSDLLRYEIPLQEDSGETEALAEELRAIATNPNLLPYVEHQDYKKEKFETIKARCPDGKEIKWSICNHCGMVYKGVPNKTTQGNHKCKCACKHSSRS